jgi:hypothetical protein
MLQSSAPMQMAVMRVETGPPGSSNRFDRSTDAAFPATSSSAQKWPVGTIHGALELANWMLDPFLLNGGPNLLPLA